MATDPRANEGPAEELPIVRIANTIIQHAIKDRASEVQVDLDQEETRVRFLIDGATHEVMRLPEHIHPPLVERYKTMADMRVEERRAPQDGHIGIRHEGNDYDLSVHSEPTPSGEKLRFGIRAR